MHFTGGSVLAIDGGCLQELAGKCFQLNKCDFEEETKDLLRVACMFCKRTSNVQYL